MSEVEPHGRSEVSGEPMPIRELAHAIENAFRPIAAALRQAVANAPESPAEPGEGDGTGAGQREAQNGSQGAMDAAIEAAAHALFAAIRLDSDPLWDEAGADTRRQCCELGDAAVAAAEPILRQAVAEEIARRITERIVDPTQVIADSPHDVSGYNHTVGTMAEIAREVGRG